MHRKVVALALGLAEHPSVVAGTRPTLEELFSAHGNFVWRSLRQLGVGLGDLEDLTQEVFLVAYRRYESWDGEQARAWLFAIARRCASAYRRRGHRLHELSVDELPEGSAESDPAARLDLERLDRALVTLDEEKRSVSILYEIEAMPMRDVAEAVGCSLHAAYARLYAARRELTRILFEVR
jgi:RNA polymerase sigma-70 factor, ECF subfamily